ncbi:MAG: gamma-glutamyltransferase [Amaricoccus sp.]|uniref:gamma-glutamyltransferase family protein n=1 Tax=Amaricoccus sp. TaxID=1872485 RepID=UPI0039E720E5
MVATPHDGATHAGAAILRRGGTAIEALIAAGAALAVLYPHFCGLGGDAVWIVSDIRGTSRCFLAIGQATEAADSLSRLPLRGPGSVVTSACLVDSWEHLLGFSTGHWGGTERLGPLLEPAIGLAQEGFPVSASQRYWHDFRKDGSDAWPGFHPLFRREGVQRQPDLARSLRLIADQGARSFYEGELASRIIAGLAATGAPLTARDLARTRTREADPIRQDYRGLTLLAPPPPTQGATTLAIMGILQHLPMADFPLGSSGYYHRLVEAVKLAFLDRDLIADPDRGGDPTQHLLDPARLAAKARRIDPGCALPWPQPFRTGDTAMLAAVDGRGNCAALLQSLYFDWGSGVVAGDTGILWQNRGAAFSLDPASPNRIAAGKRPFYTLNPGLALRNGQPHLLYGTQGADGQPQTLALLLSLLADHGLSPEAALVQPRFLLGRTFSDPNDSLKIEGGLRRAEMDGLAALGHAVVPIDALSQLGGQAAILRVDADGCIKGAHDPRSDGGAEAA